MTDTWRQILFGTPRERERAIDRLHQSDREREEFRAFVRNPPPEVDRSYAGVLRTMPGRPRDVPPPRRAEYRQETLTEPYPFPGEVPPNTVRIENPLPDSFGPRPDDFDNPVDYARSFERPGRVVPGVDRPAVGDAAVADAEPWRDPATGAPAPRRGLEPADAVGAPRRFDPNVEMRAAVERARAEDRWSRQAQTPMDMVFSLLFGRRGGEVGRVQTANDRMQDEIRGTNNPER